MNIKYTLYFKSNMAGGSVEEIKCCPRKVKRMCRLYEKYSNHSVVKHNINPHYLRIKHLNNAPILDIKNCILWWFKISKARYDYNCSNTSVEY